MASAIAACATLATLLLGGGTSVEAAVECQRVASPTGSDSAAGTATDPFRSAQRLVDSLSAGQTGCLRGGLYAQSVKVSRGGDAGAPVKLTAYPGERATLVGRLWVAKGADHVTVEGLYLNGRNQGNLPSPTVNAADVTFRSNDVTNDHTAICFVLGATELGGLAKYGRAVRPVIERNRIHNCGKLPATNHDHGIYVEGADDARISGNWIYDNADRGIQLYPDSQGALISGNVIDSNGTGVIFSGDGGMASSDNVVERNLITNSKLRFNVESWWPEGNRLGRNNLASRNCLAGSRRDDHGNGGVAEQSGFSARENFQLAPSYVDRARKDFRLTSGSRCRSLLADPEGVPGPGGSSPPALNAAPRPAPKSSVTLAARPKAFRRGARINMNGKVTHARLKRGLRVTVFVRRTGTRTWRLVGSTRADGAGRFAFRPRPRTRPSTQRVMAVAIVSGVASSKQIPLRVYRR